MTAMSFNVYTQFDMARRKAHHPCEQLHARCGGISGSLPKWMNQLNEALKPLYGSVGKGGQREQRGFNPIFIGRISLRLYQAAQNGCRTRPTGSQILGILPKPHYDLCRFEAVQRRRNVFVCHTHLEHTAVPPASNRRRRMKIIRCPTTIVLTGDFNYTPGTAEYNNVASEMANASEIALSGKTRALPSTPTAGPTA